MALPSRVFVLGVGLTTLIFFLARSSQGLPQSPNPDATSCRKWSFIRYEASPFEEKFSANADAWGHRPCEALTNLREEVDEWITLAERSMKAPLPSSTSSRVLSSFYFRSCEGEEKRVPIEPVGGILRHPRGCEDRKYLGNKSSWMVVDWHAHAIPPARNLMFDVGASLWRSGGGGASQNWMWEEYAKRNATFDAFFAWEAKKHDPVVVWTQIPAEVRPRYHWFNIPAQILPGSIDNPLEVMRRVATRDDFVVLKLDIDAAAVEIPLVEQLMADWTLTELVDEFYFEHHVNLEPLATCCWSTTRMNETGASSYRLFGRLRRLGIRAHSWV